MKWIIEIRFGFSRSKLYNKALRIAKSLPNYKLNNEVVFCGTANIKEYIIFNREFDNLIFIIEKWKTTEILLYGEALTNVNVYHHFKNKTIDSAGKYSKLLGNSTVSLNSITYENLPLPIVYYPNLYGAFFAFSDDIDSDIYFCECERLPIENYIKLRKQMPLTNYSDSKTNPLGTDFFPELISKISLNNPKFPLDMFKFKENICFYCNNKKPKLKYCLPMYGDIFKQTYGWLIQQEYFRLGIDPYQKNNILLEYFPNNIDTDDISRYVENSARQRLGFKKVGEAWTSETTLYYIIKGLYPNHKVIMHYRPKWLNGLELDVYIPDLSIAFEYQGIQHFKPVEHWGGYEQLLKQQKNDTEKIKLCKIKNVTLIHINYDEELNEQNIKAKIKNLYDSN